MRTTFLVGRLTPKTAEIVVAERDGRPAPIPGPWSLRAVVRAKPCATDPVLPNKTIH